MLYLLRLLQDNDKIRRERIGFYSLGKFFWAESIYQTVEHEHHKVQRREYIMKTFMKQSKKGFTLIEMIVVIVIIAILVALAVPSVLGYVRDAKDTQFMSEARLVYQKVNEVTLAEIVENGIIENEKTSSGKIIDIKLKDYYVNNMLSVGDYRSYPVYMLVYYDDMSIPYKFDVSSNTHVISKIGVAFTKYSPEYGSDSVLVVILQNGDVKVFRDDPRVGTSESHDKDSKWYIDWSLGI